MKEIKLTIIYILVLFVLPLIFKIELLTDPIVIVSAIVIVFLLNTQPKMDFDEAKQNRKTDKGTMFLILMTSVVGHIGTIIEWAYFSPLISIHLMIGGVFFLIFGLVFRIIAIRTLKSAFSSTIQIKEGQQLYAKGVYSVFRHPSYTGAWILLLGNGIMFQSYFGMAVLGVGMFLVYMKRIAVEEEVLKEQFGLEYEDYKKRTWKFLPGY